MNNLEVGLLVIAVTQLFFSLIFLGFYVVRIHKLDGLASNSLEKDKSLKFRICCLLLLITLAMIHIVLSFSDQNYYMYPFYRFSLVGIIVIVNFLLQLYIITREHKKKTNRSRSVVFYWILMAISQICTIIVVESSHLDISIILTILKAIITILLIVVTLLVTPTSQTSIDNIKVLMRDSNLLPLMDDSLYRETKNNERIYIQFNKQFQITLQKDHYEFSFKIAVYVCQNFNFITKSETQFIQLSKNMIQLFPNSNIANLSNITKNNSAINITKYGEQKRKTFQAFLVDLTKSDEYYVETLMNFLDIQQSQRAVLQKYKGTLYKRDTINSDDVEKMKKPLFTVGWRDEKIYISNSQMLEFFLNKSTKEISAFYQKLINQKRLKAELLTSASDQNEIAHFIYRVVNSKNLWRVFAEWMALGQAFEEKIYNMFDFWSFGFSEFDMNVIGYQASFDENKSLTYYYLLSINKKNSQNKEKIILKKRYNDFVKLDKSLRKFVITESLKNAHVPSLPPKFSPFESKTSPDSRRIYFDAYIKDIANIEGISKLIFILDHCIKLLQFLQGKNNEVVQNLSKNSQNFGEQKQSSIKSSNLDDLDFEKIT